MANPRKPTALKVLQGTDRPDRHKEEASFPVTQGAKPPDWLIDPEAGKEWELRVRLLEDAGVLTEADLTLLAHYCNSHAKLVMKWRAGVSFSAAGVPG